MDFRLFQLVISCKLQLAIEKNGTNGVPGKVPPGRGTNRPKIGTSAWQPYYDCYDQLHWQLIHESEIKLISQYIHV